MTKLSQVYNRAMLQLSTAHKFSGEEFDKPEKLDGAACQYWFNNQWYNLANLETSNGQ